MLCTIAVIYQPAFSIVTEAPPPFSAVTISEHRKAYFGLETAQSLNLPHQKLHTK